MARTPFKLRSGNAAAFKNLGSSPAKQQDFEKEYERRIGSDAYAEEQAASNNKASNERASEDFEKEYEKRIGSDAYAEETAASNSRADTDQSDNIANAQANYPGPEEKTADQTANELNSDTNKPKTLKANATQTIIKKKDKRVVVPKIAPVIPPTAEQSKKSKGTLEATKLKPKKDGALSKFYSVLSGGLLGK